MATARSTTNPPATDCESEMVNITPSPSGGELQLAAKTELIRERGREEGREGEGEGRRRGVGMGEGVSASASELNCGFHC